MKYRTVVADPPWPYKNPGEFTTGNTPVARGAGSVARYGSMSMADLLSLPVKDLVEDDAHLYMWVTNAFIPQGWKLMEAWGFRVITMLTWMKTTGEPLKGQELDVGTVRVSPGTGYYYRGATEHCLFGVRGSLKLQTDEVLPTGFLWRRKGRHSTKPESFLDLVETASPGPYLELFARRNRLGWETAFGDQALDHLLMDEVKGA